MATRNHGMYTVISSEALGSFHDMQLVWGTIMYVKHFIVVLAGTDT